MDGMSLSNASSITQQTSGVNVCSCKKNAYFLVFSLTADYKVVHFNVLVWVKITS